MQFSHEFQPESRVMYYQATAATPHILCSCSKCFQRNYPEYENLHFLQRQELEARERFMYSAHGLSLPSPGTMPATYTIDARHYYPASTLTTPRYAYERETTEYGKSNNQISYIMLLVE
jgi:hypothetical protein